MSNTTMESPLSVVANVGQFLMEVDMFPVFFTAHFTIACLIVREDSKDLGPKFRQKHPFTMWLCTLLAGLSGVFVANFLFGDPLIEVLKEHVLIIFLTLIWYLMNYSPFDIVYKIAVFPPVTLSASILQECLRVRFIYLGLLQASKVYPGAYLIMLLGGLIKGNGYGFIKIAERLIRGKWTPSTNELLDITYFAKSGFYASLVFLLHHTKIIAVPIELCYLGVIVVFVVFRLAIMLAGLKDPLLPIEKPVCTLLFGSAIEEAVVTKGTEENDKKKGKAEKKKD